MSKVEIEHWLEYVKKCTNIIRRAQKMHYKSVLRDSEKKTQINSGKWSKLFFQPKPTSHSPDHSTSMWNAQPTRNPLQVDFVRFSQK